MPHGKATHLPLHAYTIPEGKYLCTKNPTSPKPVFTRRIHDRLGSCIPESKEHLALRMTGQTNMLSKAGKKFRYHFQRFGFQKMCQRRTQEVTPEQLQGALVAHTPDWSVSKACFILDG